MAFNETPGTGKVRIAYGQYAVAYGDWTANAETVERIAEDAAGAHLLVLPELAFSGYDFPDPAALAQFAEPFGEGPASHLLKRLARAHNITLVAGYAERADGRFFNSAQLCTPDGTLYNYRKAHLFNRETLLFAPGNAPAPVIETPAGRVGIMICFDWFFPEMTRSLALRGAQIIAHPSNLVLPWCQRAMFARSLENAVFSITANRIGTERTAGRELTFTGASQILSSRGETLAQAPSDAGHLGYADIDPSRADDKSIAEINDRFRDRRPELY